MLIPIGTDVRTRRPPVANWVLVGLNVAVFLYTDALGRGQWAKEYFALNAAVPALSQYLTYQFLHGDVWHLAGNMLFLWIFGNAVCDRMGWLAYTGFYLAGGVFAGVVFAAHNHHPMLGASGAIAAVTAAFLVLYPQARVSMVVWLFYFLTTVQVPALLLIVFKIILWDNVIAPALERGVASNVAYSAHLGGYGFGLVVALLMLLLRALPRHPFDLLALAWRWSRRHGLSAGPLSIPAPARPVRVEEMDSRPLGEIPLTASERLREDILDRLTERDPEEAQRLYLELERLDPRCVLPRPQQLEIANLLAKARRHPEAARAYEAWLSAYPGAPDAPQVRLLLGMIYNRYLRRHAQAVEQLRAALDGLSVESQRAMAQSELLDALARTGSSARDTA